MLYPFPERSSVTYACPDAFIRILARPGSVTWDRGAKRNSGGFELSKWTQKVASLAPTDIVPEVFPSPIKRDHVLAKDQEERLFSICLSAPSEMRPQCRSSEAASRRRSRFSLQIREGAGDGWIRRVMRILQKLPRSTVNSLERWIITHLDLIQKR